MCVCDCVFAYRYTIYTVFDITNSQSYIIAYYKECCVINMGYYVIQSDAIIQRGVATIQLCDALKSVAVCCNTKVL